MAEEECKHPYIGSLISEIKQDIRDLREHINALKDNDDQAHDIIYNKIDNVNNNIMNKINEMEREIFSAKTIVRFTKAVVLTIIAVLAFKFGDISSIWSK